MKFGLVFEQVFDKPIERVWKAITDRRAMKTWLLDTNFVPEIGRSFEMWCENKDGSIDTYHCQVLELEPPRRMLWSWVLAGSESEGITFVAFELEPLEAGTKLTLTHSGDRDSATIEMFRSGWPAKLRALAEGMDEIDRARSS